MKVLGYIDDWVSWFVNAQINAGWWNLLIVPVELIIVMWITLKLADNCCID